MKRAPVAVFAAVEASALVLWLTISRSNWFYIDEWDVLAGRRATNLEDVFRPHNGHWITVPVLSFRLLFSLFGLRTYVPYRLVSIVLYLVVAALMLVVMRRSGVNPWIATAAASLLALFGAGWENIVLPFQIAFTGAVAFGLVCLILADRDGPLAPRDGWALGAGVLALMCSGVGIVMVAVVGGTVLARRGSRVALAYVVPLGACYALWLLAIGRRDHSVAQFTPGDVLRFVETGYRAAYGALGPFRAFGVVIVVALVAGLVLAFRQRAGTPRVAELTPPIALLVASLVLLVITALNRADYGADWARQSRYVSLVAAMTLPALVLGADAVATRWPRTLPVVCVLFLLGIPANIHAATRAQHDILRPRDTATRDTMLSLPLEPLARRVPRSVHPEPTTATAVTIGWLLDQAARGRLAAPGRVSRRLHASNAFRLSFDRPDGPAPTTHCRSSRTPYAVNLRER